jgi:MinD superfamily P-loop ATPase
LLKEVVVISGKGGTGKTSLTAAFATLGRHLILADCDVDAPDLHILTGPKVMDESEFVGSELPVVDPDLCTECGTCVESCRFGAISDEILIEEMRCEDCGVCQLVCPEGAIRSEERRSGTIYRSDTRFGPMVHAKLDAGEEISGKLVSQVKKTVRDLAASESKSLILIDGPPGIGCSVIASISGADYLVVVTEPTYSAMEDMKRALALAEHFGIRTGVCINKSDINPVRVEEITAFCRGLGTRVLGCLPYDHVMTEAMLQAKTVIELGDSEMARLIGTLWHRIEEEAKIDHI